MCGLSPEETPFLPPSYGGPNEFTLPSPNNNHESQRRDHSDSKKATDGGWNSRNINSNASTAVPTWEEEKATGGWNVPSSRSHVMELSGAANMKESKANDGWWANDQSSSAGFGNVARARGGAGGREFERENVPMTENRMPFTVCPWQWRCEKCTHVNHKSIDRCFKCKAV